VDDAIDLLRTIQVVDEEPIRTPVRSGTGVGVIEAPRGSCTTWRRLTNDTESGCILPGMNEKRDSQQESESSRLEGLYGGSLS
jgi:hypothetical protein